MHLDPQGAGYLLQTFEPNADAAVDLPTLDLPFWDTKSFREVALVIRAATLLSINATGSPRNEHNPRSLTRPERRSS